MIRKFRKKMQQYRNRKRLAVYLIFCMVVGCTVGMGDFVGIFVKAEDVASEENLQTISMTEVYNQGNYGVSVEDIAAVTIASKEEMEMFRQYVEAGNPTEAVTFRQMADIIMSEYTFQFDEEKFRAGFYLDSALMGTVDVNGYTYQDFASQANKSFKAMGITSEEQPMWEPIGQSCDFYGHYDGNGYVIKGLWSVKKEGNVGLFSRLYCGSISNVIMKNSLFVGKDSVGALVGTVVMSGTIKNCVVETINLMEGEGNCGGLVGCSLDNIRIDDCDVSGTIRGGYIAGGCIGNMAGGEISSCKFIGEKSKVIGVMSFGGIVGSLSRSGSIHHCQNYGKIGSIYYGISAGGIVGDVTEESSIWECENYGEVGRCQSSAAGGIVCSIFEKTNIWQCKNYGELYGACVGGIVCEISYKSEGEGGTKIYNCINSGSTKDETSIEVGGIIGISFEDTWIANCENRADNLTGMMVSGIVGVGAAECKVEVLNCMNRCDVFVVKRGAGILSSYPSVPREIIVDNCLNLGKIEAESYARLGNIAVDINGGSIKNCYYRTNGVSVDGTAMAEVTNCYAVTDTQIYGTENVVKIGQQEGGCADTFSVIEALNNKVDEVNALVGDVESDGFVLLERWTYDAIGLPIISNIGSEELEAKPLPTATPLPTTILPTTTPEPTKTPLVSPTVEPAPDITAEQQGSAAVEMTESPAATPQESPKISFENVNFQNQKVTGFKAVAKTPKKIKLTWNPMVNATEYEIYRSPKKKSGYKLVQTVEGKTQWMDKKLQKGKKYFYKVCAVIGTGSNLVQGKMSEVKKVKLPWYITPQVVYKKGITVDNTRYLTIRLKKYQGIHVEILAKTEKGKFQKILLSDSQIKKNRGIFSLSYSKKGGVLYCKVRTYSKVKHKKRYSLYTKVKKIRL